MPQVLLIITANDIEAIVRRAVRAELMFVSPAPTPKLAKTYVSDAELAVHYGVSRAMIHNWVAVEGCPHSMKGKCRRFTRTAVEAWFRRKGRKRARLKQAKGAVHCTNDGRAVARVTLKKRASVRIANCREAAQEEKCMRTRAQVAQQLRGRVSNEQACKALNVIAETSESALRNAIQGARGLLKSARWQVPNARTVPTFGKIGKDWTDGKLAARYPDQVRLKRTADDDASRLRLYVYPVLKDVPIDRVTLDLCEEIMRKLPVELAVATRRNVGQLVSRILAMAVYPMRLIERSPIPKGFLPNAAKQKAMAYLYPDEDARLMACTAVPLCYRLLWGFLAREGLRESEAIELTWEALNLERGAVRLDKNKTDDPRTWALSPGVVLALKAYRKQHRPDAKPTDRVFRNTLGRPFIKHGLAEMLRAHLKLIRLEQERPELFVSNGERRRIRVHDLRGTFVTISLANGRSESWISDRTGHRSSQMIARYKRIARTFDELHQGELVPLAEALPDLIGP